MTPDQIEQGGRLLEDITRLRMAADQLDRDHPHVDFGTLSDDARTAVMAICKKDFDEQRSAVEAELRAL